MERHAITIYIEGHSYQLVITKDEEIKETTYEVITAHNPLAEFIPDAIDWQQDAMFLPGPRMDIVEQEQIARIIWTDILDMLP